MRRKGKTILAFTAFAIVGTLAYEIIRQWLEKRNEGDNLTLDNFDYERTVYRTVRNGLVGGFLGYTYYCYKVDSDKEMPFDSDRYLRMILAGENLKNDPIYLRKVLSLKKNVKQKLNEAFQGKLVTYPLDAGSFAKRTAINSGYDLDIVLAFAKGSYPTLENMFLEVNEVVKDTFGRMATVTTQTKAITLSFEIADDINIDLDVVPGREINDFQRDKELNLYVRPNFNWQRSRSFKTNPYQQRHIVTNKPEVRNIIKLLKKYCLQSNFNLPTILIEQCVVEALSDSPSGLNLSITENLLDAMDYLVLKLQQSRFFDYSNSNNNLNKKVNYSTKTSILSLLRNDITKVEENPRYLIEIFGRQPY